MCIDLVAGRKSKNTKPTSPRSEDIYLKLTMKLYDFIHRRTECHFSKVIHHRLCMSKVNKAPLSLSRLIWYMQGKEDKMSEVLAQKVTALRFTERARAHIEKAGGECLTFDQLALRTPLG